MKRVFGLLLAGSLLLASCSKKTRPTKSEPPPRTTSNSTVITEPVTTTPVTETPPAEIPPATAAVMAPMIVIDEKGGVVTPREKLPVELASKVNYTKISRSYTPAQRQNLITRFKIVPPRVLYVPDQLASKSAKGTYVVYRKKFWYWKKEDGLFHIDETYYQ